MSNTSNPVGKWLKCEYCGSEIHANTIGGDLKNHQCKDHQIANLQAELQGCRELTEDFLIILKASKQPRIFDTDKEVQAWKRLSETGKI